MRVPSERPADPGRCPVTMPSLPPSEPGVSLVSRLRLLVDAPVGAPESKLAVTRAAEAVFGALELVRAPEAWAVQPAPGRWSTGAGIVVGHPDTGYVTHEELEPQALDLTRDRDVVSGDDDATDPLESGHFPEVL